MYSVRKELDLEFFPVMAVIYLLKAPADVWRELDCGEESLRSV